MTSHVPPKLPATRLTNAQEALAVAQRLAAQFSRESAVRDRERRLPVSELCSLFQSGIGALTVPRQFGGIDLPADVLAEIFVILCAADSAIGQVPQNHFYALEVLRVNGTAQQQERLFAEVLNGVHLGNALAEFNSAAAHERTTALMPEGDQFRLNGRKFYATGALFADRIPTSARDSEGREWLAFVPGHAPGVTIIDDWSGFGQRTTGSGSVVFENVALDADDVVAFQSAFERPTSVGPFAQLMHAAIDQGIARAAFNDMLGFVRTRARPWPDSGVEQASRDPLTIDRTGKLAAKLSAGDALLEIAGKAVELARIRPDADSVAEASITVARARAWTTEVSLEAGNLLFELSGTRAALQAHNLDRHWRNARTHTLHDPVRWKYPAIGNYLLNGVKPPRRGTL